MDWMIENPALVWNRLLENQQAEIIKLALDKRQISVSHNTSQWNMANRFYLFQNNRLGMVLLIDRAGWFFPIYHRLAALYYYEYPWCSRHAGWCITFYWTRCGQDQTQATITEWQWPKLHFKWVSSLSWRSEYDTHAANPIIFILRAKLSAGIVP